MKKKVSFALLFCIVFLYCLAGCSNNNSINYNTEKSVKLYDYKNIEIEKSYTEINEDEIESIILLDLSYNDCYKAIENRTTIEKNDIILLDITSDIADYCTDNYYYYIENEEFGSKFTEYIIGKKSGNNYNTTIEQNGIKINISFNVKGIFQNATISDEEIVTAFYNCSNINEVKSFIRDRAYKEIIYNYMWDMVLEKSEITEISSEIQNKINQKMNDTANDNQSLEEIQNYYYERIIAQAIVDQEEIKIDNAEINKVKENISKKTAFQLMIL